MLSDDSFVEHQPAAAALTAIEDSRVFSQESATSTVTAYAHLATFLILCVVLRTFLMRGVWSDDLITPALIMISVTAGVNIGIDISIFKVHRRVSTGLDFNRYNPSLFRSLTKFLGVIGTFLYLYFLYWLFPEYAGNHYSLYWKALRVVLPVSVPFVAVYVFYVDAYMPLPLDGYYNMGLVLLLRWERINSQVFRQHLLSWTVKGFFTPLMFVPFCKDTSALLKVGSENFSTWTKCFDFIWSFLYYIDLHFANVGYLMTFRLSDTHVRATENTIAGWLAALLCYPPINSVDRFYLNYRSDVMWGSMLKDQPMIKFAWGSVILLLTGIYALASVHFGIRFSNLTNRGIITCGPYSWTKHPAYITKNISWWMLYCPFAANGGWQVRLRKSLHLLGFNLIYFFRAKCEEAMLASDPCYVRYSRVMDSKGIFRQLNELMHEQFKKGNIVTGYSSSSDRDQ